MEKQRAQVVELTAKIRDQDRTQEVAELNTRISELADAEHDARSEVASILRDYAELEDKLKLAKDRKSGQDEQIGATIEELCAQIKEDAKIIDELKREKKELSKVGEKNEAVDVAKNAEFLAVVKERDDLLTEVDTLTEELCNMHSEEDDIQKGLHSTKLRSNGHLSDHRSDSVRSDTSRLTTDPEVSSTVNALSSENAYLQDRVADALFEAETVRRQMREMEGQIESDFKLIAELSSELQGNQHANHQGNQQQAWVANDPYHGSQTTLAHSAVPTGMNPVTEPQVRTHAPTTLQRWAGRSGTMGSPGSAGRSGIMGSPGSAAAALPSMTASKKPASFLR